MHIHTGAFGWLRLHWVADEWLSAANQKWVHEDPVVDPEMLSGGYISCVGWRLVTADVWGALYTHQWQEMLSSQEGKGVFTWLSCSFFLIVMRRISYWHGTVVCLSVCLSVQTKLAFSAIAERFCSVSMVRASARFTTLTPECQILSSFFIYIYKFLIRNGKLTMVMFFVLPGLTQAYT